MLSKLILFFAIVFATAGLTSDQGSYGYNQEQVQYIKANFGIDLSQETTQAQMTDSQKDAVIEKFQSDSANFPALAKDTDKAVDLWVKYAAFILRMRGFDFDADELENEYWDHQGMTYQFYRYGFQGKNLGAIGDHPPMSQWLADWYQKVLALLGEQMCEFLHLDDINIINYTVPIVFQVCEDARFPPPEIISQEDYRDHFVPFAGVVTWWTTWGICTGVTWGAGAICFICTPIADVSERVMVNRVAPPLSDKIYQNKCQ